MRQLHRQEVPRSLLEARTAEGLTALMLAARGGYEEIVALLLAKGARGDEETGELENVLHMTMERGFDRISEQLLRHDASLATQRSAHGYLPRDMHPVIRELLSAEGFGAADVRRLTATYSGEPYVFLGGACNPTTWRQSVAVPILEAAGLHYVDPQLDEWREGVVSIEAVAKERASVLLFVISAETRGLASCIEAAEFMTLRRRVVLVVEDVPAGSTFSGSDSPASAAEIADINRGRAYLRDVAMRHGTPIFTDLRLALELVVSHLKH